MKANCGQSLQMVGAVGLGLHVQPALYLLLPRQRRIRLENGSSVAASVPRGQHSHVSLQQSPLGATQPGRWALPGGFLMLQD